MCVYVCVCVCFEAAIIKTGLPPARGLTGSFIARSPCELVKLVETETTTYNYDCIILYYYQDRASPCPGTRRLLPLVT